MPSDDEDFRERLGRAVRLRRTEIGMKRRELAEQAELSYPYISEIENGSKEPSNRALRQIAAALDVSSADLGELADRMTVDGSPGSVLMSASPGGEPGYSGDASVTSSGGPYLPSRRSKELQSSPASYDRQLHDIVAAIVRAG